MIWLVLALAAPALAATLHLTGPAGAGVQLDGRDLGMLPIPALDLPPGVFELECRARGYIPLNQTVILESNDAVARVNLRPLPVRRQHVLTGSAIYAGLGQLHSGARLRGWAYFLGESIGLASALVAEVGRTGKKDDYTNAKDAYQTAVDPDEIAYWKGQTTALGNDMKSFEDQRDASLALAAGVWALSLLDAWLLVPTVDVGGEPVLPATAAAGGPAAPSLHAAVVFGF